MLRTLYIRDYAIIDELEVEFQSGLNILTGETGAGKSIIVGALKLITGERASADSIRSGGVKAIIEGVFDDIPLKDILNLLDEHDLPEEPVLIMRREITKTHSRAFINDTPVKLTLMRQVASKLIDLHGQHEHQSLLRVNTHLDLIDGFGHLADQRSSYRSTYQEVVSLTRELEELSMRQNHLDATQERLGFEISEIDTINPQEGEEDQLQNELSRLENAEQLYNITASMHSMLYAQENSTTEQLALALTQLQDLAYIDPALKESSEEINQAYISVKEISQSLQEYSSNIEFNPSRLEKIRERLGDFDILKRKYGGSLNAVLDYRKEIGKEYARLADNDMARSTHEQHIEETKQLLSQKAHDLSNQRHRVATQIESSITSEFVDLGMAAGKLKVQIQQHHDSSGWITPANKQSKDLMHYKAFSHGMDLVEFLITTNMGEELRPLARVASGGEISRIMLAIKRVLAQSGGLPIMVFDEIDVGISGSIAQKVGNSMADLARHHQIITITHLPQIAALAHAHYVVEKRVTDGRTKTMIRRLSHDESVEHLAKLIAGGEITETMRESARELMQSQEKP
ncbi:MAG: DNA repair protein RecN [Bacteroidetes bacterium]|nr:DNA repair protein RecN [Bacteroidota bacterium]